MNVIGAVVIENMNKSSKGPYYGVAGAWCFITNAYDVERALMHYTPVRYLIWPLQMRTDLGLLDACRIRSHYADVYSSLPYDSWKSAHNTEPKRLVQIPVHIPIGFSTHCHRIYREWG